ncbi:peptidylprolyl isomerase [Paenibacillus dokdonensis]|uniref:peptidylprolyl isomerase n=1 Tax=Paenibacillus dokdonensis TaxID=2567944 RepID=A0ABU6GGT2_9BACL|nr:peptidylprolyl isomerase [Paenibacillus dokdonensis]MEC0238954.1 peptidylprolyl isomerase [Paenibacillus dokdonensis]
MSDKERDTLNNEEGLTPEEQSGDIQEQNNQPIDQNKSDEPFVETEKETPVPTMLAKNSAAPAKSAAVPPTPSPATGMGSKVWMIVSLVLAIVLVIVLIKPPFAKGGDNEAVATVNGDKITKDKLYGELVSAGGTQTLDGMISETLVNQEADKKGIKVTQADIDKETAFIKKNYGSDAEFEAALQQNNLSKEDFNKQMDMQVKLRKLIEPDVKVSDDDVKKYFDENKATFDTPEQVKASHILVATKEEADAILKQLKDGADFATLAKEKSTDPGSKANGGDLGYFGRNQMYKEFEDEAFKLKDGEMSGVIKTDAGYHIIKRTGYKAAHAATLEEKKADIKEQLIYQAIMTKAPTWLSDIKAKAKITNNLEEEQKKKDADASKTDSSTTDGSK